MDLSFGCPRAAWLAVLAAALFAAIGAAPAFAVRAERNAANQLPRAPAKSLPVRERSSEQTDAAQEAVKAGILVSWSAEEGVPQCVRGAGLDRRPGLKSGNAAKLPATTNDESRAHAALAGVGRLFGFRAVDKEFKSRSSQRDELGFLHVRMTQMHEGLRVVGGELIAHFDADGNAYEINGRYLKDLDAPIVARLTPEAAVLVAKEDLLSLGEAPGKVVRGPELVVFAVGQAPALAYELSLRTDTPDKPGAWPYWVDAQSGEILLRCSDIRTVAAPTGNGATANITGSMLSGEGGAVTNVTGWRQNGGYYYLHSTQRWWQVYNIAVSGTYTDKNTYAYRSTANWGTSDRAEMSLAHAFEKVQRYYFSMFGLRSFDGGGAMARANVHYGNNYVNAFWDTDAQAFYFGDGDGVDANSLAVLDISGHEFSHAVAEHTAGFVYAYESGALDESFADISGACIEFLSQRDGRSVYPSRTAGRADWLIGEDCWKSHTALRDMRSPANSATVGAGNEQPSRYGGRYWYSGSGDSGGVHYNSGVQNFFFYLLADGGSGVNDGVSYSVTGIGVSNAARVAYRTLTVYCTPGTDYHAVRDAWMSAAGDLNPAWVASVDSAWNAAGLGNMGITPYRGLSVSGPVGGPFIPVERFYTLTNFGVVPLAWTATHTQSWVGVTPAGGVLAGGAATNVLVRLNSGADGLGPGYYSDAVVFSNAASGGRVAVGVALRAGYWDDLTELFSDSDNDLNGYMITFKPDAVATSYTATVESVSGYPSDPAGGTALALGDDSTVLVLIPDGKRVRLFGVEYDRFYVGSNGYITFGAGDSDLSETLADHFDLPRISALFNDFNPASPYSGQVTWRLHADRVAVTYDGVPEYNSSAPNRMQLEMFLDGTIRIAYPLLSVSGGLAGLSPGHWDSAAFRESDLNGYGTPPVLQVTPPSIAFGAVQAGTDHEAVFTVSNGGECALHGTASVTGVFSVVSGASYYLGMGISHSVRVRYSPVEAGVHSNDVAFSGGSGAARAVTGRAIGNGDQDGDGASDWEEYMAGTSATNGSDYFRIEDHLSLTQGLVIRWDSATGRWYTVSAATNLAGAWMDVHQASGTGAQMSYTNPPSGASVDFLRVGLRLE